MLLLELLDVCMESVDALLKLFRLAVESAGKPGQDGSHMLDGCDGLAARHGGQAAHAFLDRFLADDLEEARSPVRQVRAAAEFDGVFDRGRSRDLRLRSAERDTGSGYFSPKTARTPGIFFASSNGLMTAVTGRSA